MTSTSSPPRIKLENKPNQKMPHRKLSKDQEGKIIFMTFSTAAHTGNSYIKNESGYPTSYAQKLDKFMMESNLKYIEQ